jgi:IS5 family transposase
VSKSVGRPATKKGPAVAKKRAAARKAYQSLPLAKRKAIVQTRDKEAQRQGDARRLAKDKVARNAYHKEQAQAKTKASPKPATCQAPGCKNKPQFHHQGKDAWLCPTHHALARGYKK